MEVFTKHLKGAYSLGGVEGVTFKLGFEGSLCMYHLDLGCRCTQAGGNGIRQRRDGLFRVMRM